LSGDQLGVAKIREMASMIRRIQAGVLFSYIICVLFLPRLSTLLGESVHRNLRLEDLIFPIMLFAVALSLHRRTLNYALGPILYICYGFLITLLGLLLYAMPPKALFIWGKEFQYIVGFVLFLECMRSNPRLLLLFEKVAIAAGLVGVVFLLSRMTDIHRLWGQYGMNHFTTPIASSLSAWMYFNLFFLSAVIVGSGDVERHTKTIIKICIPLLALGALLSGTRTMFIVLPLFISIYVWLTLQPVKLGLWFMMVAGIVFFAIFRNEIVSYLYSIQADMIAIPLDRLGALFSYAQGKDIDLLILSRGNSWAEVLGAAYDRWSFVIGGGRGFSHMDASGVMPSLGLGGDNQYTVNIAEIGIFGSVLLLLAIGSVYSFVHRSLRYLYIPYVLVYLIAGMSMEIFQLSKSGQLFWLIAAYFIIKSEELKSRETAGCAPDRIRVNMPVRREAES